MTQHLFRTQDLTLIVTKEKKKPGVGVEVYLFDLFDENEKSGDEFERHFGIFGVNGAKAYDLTFNWSPTHK